MSPTTPLDDRRAAGSHWLSIFVAALVVPELLNLFVRWVLCPLGLYRAAYYAGSVSCFTTQRDAAGAGLWASARALAARCEPPDPEALAWIEERRDRNKEVGCGAVLGTALLQSIRGDDASARRWLESIEDFHPSVRPRVVLSIAREWLAAHAASEGRWRDVCEIASRPGPRSAATRFLGHASARLLREPTALTDGWLWVSWLCAPRRREMRRLLDRALEHSTERLSTSASAPMPGEPSDLLSNAMARHSELVRRASQGSLSPDVGLAEVVEVGRAWDRALADPRVEAELRRRALSEGAREIEETIAQLPRVVATDLALCAERCRLTIAKVCQGSATLEDAAWRLRDDELRRLEERCQDLRRAIDRVGEPLEVWARWCRVRESHPRALALAGDDLSSYLFSETYGAACNVAVRLHNQGHQTPLANAMFTWLLRRAEDAGAEDAVDLLRRNAAAGP
jgi:hypothetical protein